MFVHLVIASNTYSWLNCADGMWCYLFYHCDCEMTYHEFPDTKTLNVVMCLASLYR